MAKNIQLKNISEHDFEQCLKCTICTAYCPVSAVEPLYPGPKQAGPDLMRYRLKNPAFFSESLKLCLNCKRCEVACPNDVKIGDIIQEARIRYSRHRPSLRDRMLANTDFVGGLATKVAPVANRSLSLPLVREVLHTVAGIDKHAKLPAYSSTTFTRWYNQKAATAQNGFSRFVSYFHGCYVNYNYPRLGQAFVKVMNACGYGVHLLKKEKCCGVALIANGLPGQAGRQGKVNLKSMLQALGEGNEAVLTTSSTCTFTMRDEYESLLKLDNRGVRDRLMLATRFIFRLLDRDRIRLAFRKDFNMRVAYHSACHMERMGWTVYSTQLLRQIPGLRLTMLESQCCGIAGTYGFKRENYERSQRIGSALFEQIKAVNPEYVACDCETCKWQIEMSTGYRVLNPIEILAEALDVEETRRLNP